MIIDLYQAEVIKESTLEDGQIKVRLIPEMLDVEEDLLPYVKCFNATANEEQFEYVPPQIGSKVFVFFMDNVMFKDGFYIANQAFKGFFNYAKVKSKLSDVVGDADYPNVKFKYDKGTISFTTDDGYHGVYHQSDSYVVFEPEGNIKIHSDNEIHLNGNNKSFVTYTELDLALQTFLTQLLTSLSTTPIAGNGTVQPSWTNFPTSIDISASETQTVKTGG